MFISYLIFYKHVALCRLFSKFLYQTTIFFSTILKLESCKLLTKKELGAFWNPFYKNLAMINYADDTSVYMYLLGFPIGTSKMHFPIMVCCICLMLRHSHLGWTTDINSWEGWKTCQNNGTLGLISLRSKPACQFKTSEMQTLAYLYNVYLYIAIYVTFLHHML